MSNVSENKRLGLNAEIASLKRELAEYQSVELTHCAWCGEVVRMQPADMERHGRECKQSPLALENSKLRAIASSGAALIRSLKAAVEALSDREYPIRISRREFMDLPLDTRRKIMERQVNDFPAWEESAT